MRTFRCNSWGLTQRGLLVLDGNNKSPGKGWRATQCWEMRVGSILSFLCWENSWQKISGEMLGLHCWMNAKKITIVTKILKYTSSKHICFNKYVLGEGLTSLQTRATAVARCRTEAKYLVGKDVSSVENKWVGTLSREGAGDTQCSEPRGAMSVTAFVMVNLGWQLDRI